MKYQGVPAAAKDCSGRSAGAIRNPSRSASERRTSVVRSRSALSTRAGAHSAGPGAASSTGARGSVSGRGTSAVSSSTTSAVPWDGTRSRQPSSAAAPFPVVESGGGRVVTAAEPAGRRQRTVPAPTSGAAGGSGRPCRTAPIGARSEPSRTVSVVVTGRRELFTSRTVSRRVPTPTRRVRSSRTVGSACGSPRPGSTATKASSAASRTACPTGTGSAPSTVSTSSDSTRTSACRTPAGPPGRTCPSGPDSAAVGAARQLTSWCSADAATIRDPLRPTTSALTASP